MGDHWVTIINLMKIKKTICGHSCRELISHVLV